MSIGIPAAVRNKALAAGAEAWLDGLPALVANLERDWAITVGRPFEQGTEAFVAEVALDDGTAAVLKVLMPREGIDVGHEITALRLADGDGCVELLRAHELHDALLLERLGTPMSELGLPIERRHQILCEVAERFWRPAPGCGLPTGAEKGRWLVERIPRVWEALGRPCSERAVEHAVDCAAHRIAAHVDERAVLVHGDIHQWNALSVGDGFKLVDPDGLFAEPEYDLGILMREDPAELRAGDPYTRAEWLAHRSGLDAIAIWEWGVVERVSTGLLCTEIELQPFGRQMLELADRISEGRA